MEAILVMLFTACSYTNGFSSYANLDSSPPHVGLGILTPNSESSSSYNSQSWKALLKSTVHDRDQLGMTENSSNDKVVNNLLKESSSIPNRENYLRTTFDQKKNKTFPLPETIISDHLTQQGRAQQNVEIRLPNDLNNKVEKNLFGPMVRRERRPRKIWFRRNKLSNNSQLHNTLTQIRGKTLQNEMGNESRFTDDPSSNQTLYNENPKRFARDRATSGDPTKLRREAELLTRRGVDKSLTLQTGFRGIQNPEPTKVLTHSIADFSRRSRLPKSRRAQAVRQSRGGLEFTRVFPPRSPNFDAVGDQNNFGVPLNPPEFGMKINGGKGTFQEMNSRRAFNNNASLFFTILNDDGAFDFSEEFNRAHDSHFRPSPMLSLIPPERATQEEVSPILSRPVNMDPKVPQRSFHTPNGETHPFSFGRHPPMSPPLENSPQITQNDRNFFRVTLDVDADDVDEISSSEFLRRPLVTPAANGIQAFLSPPPPPPPPHSGNIQGREQTSTSERFQLRNPQLLHKNKFQSEESYKFGYEVRSDGASHGHKEERKGHRVEGVYHVDLPNGYRQIVSYYADETGYHPTITYEKILGFKQRRPVNGKAVPTSIITELVPPPISAEDYKDSASSTFNRYHDNDQNFKDIIFPLTFSSSDRHEVALPSDISLEKSLEHFKGADFSESANDTLDGLHVTSWSKKDPSPLYRAPPTSVSSTNQSSTLDTPTTLSPTTPEPPIIDPMYIRIESNQSNSTTLLTKNDQ